MISRHFKQDELEQLVDVALGGEGHADVVQLVQLLALADEGVVELLDHPAAVDGVEGAVQPQPQARGGQGLDEDVVQEGEAVDEVVGFGRVGGGHEQGAAVSARADPGFERALFRVEAGGVGQDEGAALAFDDGLDGGQGLDLVRGDPGRDLTGDEVARLAPDENVGHSA